MSLLSEFERVNSARPCPICGKGTWCLAARDGHAAICQRVQSTRRWKDAGWFHQLGETRPTQSRHDVARRGDGGSRVRSISIRCTPRDAPDFANLVAAYAVHGGSRLKELSAKLGVSLGSLVRLGTAASDDQFWFPMSDGAGAIVGIRVRTLGGDKFAVAGSRQGIFVPTEVPIDFGDRPLLLPEGPTDTAAILDLGFDAIGRPSCSQGTREVLDFVRLHHVRRAVVVADADRVGLEGAATLARCLRTVCKSVRVIRPPEGLRDVREWKRRGATRDNVLRSIDAAPDVRLRLASIVGSR